MKHKLVWESVGRRERIVARLELDPFAVDDDAAYLWYFEFERRERDDALGGERWTRVDDVPQYLLVAALRGFGVDLEPYSPMWSNAEPETAEPEDAE